MKSSLLCVIGMSLLCLVAMEAIMEFVELKEKSYLECAKLTGVSNDTILSVNKGEWPEENDALKEWVHCVLVVSNHMTEQGVFRLAIALKNVSNTERVPRYEKIDLCRPTHTFNVPPEEIAWHFAKCFQKEDPEHSLF